MKILASFKNIKTNTFSIVMGAMFSISLLGFGIQFEAIYSDYLVTKSKIENSGITICFYSPYYYRWFVILLGYLGAFLSIAILYKFQWKLPKSNLYKFILISPMIIFILDKLITEMILF